MYTAVHGCGEDGMRHNTGCHVAGIYLLKASGHHALQTVPMKTKEEFVFARQHNLLRMIGDDRHGTSNKLLLKLQLISGILPCCIYTIQLSTREIAHRQLELWEGTFMLLHIYHTYIRQKCSTKAADDVWYSLALWA